MNLLVTSDSGVALESVLDCVAMATDDHSTGDADSIPTTPLGADPLVPQATATAPAPTPPDKPGFFRRTWVWVTAAAVAAVILLGGGIGIGAALTRQPGDSESSSFDHHGPDGSDQNGDRGPQGHAEDGDRDGDGEDGDHHGRGNPDGGNPQERPTPAPSDDTTNP